jgi:hypothetical protein
MGAAVVGFSEVESEVAKPESRADRILHELYNNNDVTDYYDDEDRVVDYAED